MIDAQMLAVVALVTLGLSAVVFRKNMIKIVMGISVIGSGVNLFLVSMGYREGSTAPIFTASRNAWMSLPTPQALTLTSIVISLAVTALMLSFAVLFYEKYGSIDTTKRRLKQ
ncbi:MAG: cation:proton antiporter subunit C [Candidatus Aenigmarchaeota archaeon]|nr:cation:proton antiporter subunit C [Candidatus Aenigmarchaeota archaeon]